MTRPSFAGVSVSSNDVVEHGRQVARSLNAALQGKLNCVLDVNVAANVVSTNVVDVRLTPFSAILFDPLTANAATELAAGTVFVRVSNRFKGSCLISHANTTQTDRSYSLVVIG